MLSDEGIVGEITQGEQVVPSIYVAPGQPPPTLFILFICYIIYINTFSFIRRLCIIQITVLRQFIQMQKVLQIDFESISSREKTKVG